DDGRTPSFRLYRNPRALPRWFVPAQVDVIRPGDLENWIAALDDGRRVAVYDPALAAQPPADAAVATVTAVAAVPARAGRITLQVTAPRPVLVATSLGWPEGWRVWKGESGVPLPMTVVNGAFLGFRVSAGTTRVELRFVPPGLIAGCVLAAIALGVCALLLARGLLLRAAR
ncbi:MAG TPA: YfhO family protein, partial [Thermoanaerobaculia bacterium]